MGISAHAAQIGADGPQFTAPKATAHATSCPPPINVSTEGANQVFQGTASGPGGAVSKQVLVSIDKTAPLVLVTSPADNSSTATSPLALAGVVTAGGSPIVRKWPRLTRPAGQLSSDGFCIDTIGGTVRRQLAQLAGHENCRPAPLWDNCAWPCRTVFGRSCATSTEPRSMSATVVSTRPF